MIKSPFGAIYTIWACRNCVRLSHEQASWIRRVINADFKYKGTCYWQWTFVVLLLWEGVKLCAQHLVYPSKPLGTCLTRADCQLAGKMQRSCLHRLSELVVLFMWGIGVHRWNQQMKTRPTKLTLQGMRDGALTRRGAPGWDVGGWRGEGATYWVHTALPVRGASVQLESSICCPVRSENKTRCEVCLTPQHTSMEIAPTARLHCKSQQDLQTLNALKCPWDVELY